MNKNTLPEKPLCLRKRAAILKLEQAINETAKDNLLSFSDLEEILYRFYVEAKRGADEELKTAEMVYCSKLTEYKRKQNAEKEENSENE